MKRPRIPFPVRYCSGYSDRRHPAIHEMEDIAWVLRTDARRKGIGFVQARSLKPRDRFVLTDEIRREFASEGVPIPKPFQLKRR